MGSWHLPAAAERAATRPRCLRRRTVSSPGDFPLISPTKTRKEESRSARQDELISGHGRALNPKHFRARTPSPSTSCCIKHVEHESIRKFPFFSQVSYAWARAIDRSVEGMFGHPSAADAAAHCAPPINHLRLMDSIPGIRRGGEMGFFLPSFLPSRRRRNEK